MLHDVHGNINLGSFDTLYPARWRRNVTVSTALQPYLEDAHRIHPPPLTKLTLDPESSSATSGGIAK